RAAEVRAYVVRVPEAQLHLDIDGFHVRRNVLDANASAEKRRPEIDPATESMRAFRTAEKLQKNATALHSGSRLRQDGEAAAVDGFEDLVAATVEQSLSYRVAQGFGIVKVAVARFAQE